MLIYIFPTFLRKGGAGSVGGLLLLFSVSGMRVGVTCAWESGCGMGGYEHVNFDGFEERRAREETGSPRAQPPNAGLSALLVFA